MRGFLITAALAGAALAQHLPSAGDEVVHRPAPRVLAALTPDAGPPDAGQPDAGSPPPPPLFALAPPTGEGMPAAPCTCPYGWLQAPDGGDWSFWRANGTAICTKGGYGLRTTGIANGDLVSCGNFGIRVEEGADGVNGVFMGAGAYNELRRSLDVSNAAWSNVGTPTLTGGRPSPFAAAAWTNAATEIADDDAAAFEGRQQTTTGYNYARGVTLHCYVKAGTADSVRLGIDSTYATATGLSSTTWTIVKVYSATGTSGRVVSFTVGDSAAVTGSVIYGGCALTGGKEPARIQVTTTNRGATMTDSLYINAPGAMNKDVMSMAATVSRAWATETGNAQYPTLLSVGQAYAIASSAGGATILGGAFNDTGTNSYAQRVSCHSTDADGFFFGYASTGWVPPAAPPLARVWCSADGSVIEGSFGGAALSPSTTPLPHAYNSDYVSIGGDTGQGPEAILSNICFDPNPARCR